MEFSSWLRHSVKWLMNRMESLWMAAGASCRQWWNDLNSAFYTHLTPGEKFGRDAVYAFLVGTVPAFLAGSTSAALLIGIVPGFIGGLGLIVAFSHAQASRSRERRAKVCRHLHSHLHIAPCAQPSALHSVIFTQPSSHLHTAICTQPSSRSQLHISTSPHGHLHTATLTQPSSHCFSILPYPHSHLPSAIFTETSAEISGQISAHAHTLCPQ